jgi:acyl-CoA synthetase (AMP-forming)/AMP-acid ligase II
MEARANRLAHHLAAQGVRPGDHVGIYAYNSVEWVESLWAVFKLRAVWININYRYVEDELRYLFDNADLVGLI